MTVHSDHWSKNESLIKISNLTKKKARAKKYRINTIMNVDFLNGSKKGKYSQLAKKTSKIACNYRMLLMITYCVMSIWSCFSLSSITWCWVFPSLTKVHRFYLGAEINFWRSSPTESVLYLCFLFGLDSFHR